jgi:hypothetical protein
MQIEIVGADVIKQSGKLDIICLKTSLPNWITLGNEYVQLKFEVPRHSGALYCKEILGVEPRVLGV